MASLLTSGALAKTVAKAVGKTLAYDVTLHKRDAGSDAHGNMAATFTDYTLKGLHLQKSAAAMFYEGAPEGATEIILLQNGAAATPARNDQITAQGTRYEILTIKSDPANATWTLTVRET